MKIRKPLVRCAAFAASDSVDAHTPMGNRKLLVVALALTLMLSSCAAVVPPQGLKAVPPGHLYAGSYINARAPNSDGWRLISASASGLEFARVGEDSNESFGAQVLIFPLRKAQGPDEFIALIKRCIDSPDWCRQIGRQARRFAEAHYSNGAIGRQLSVFYNAIRKLV